MNKACVYDYALHNKRIIYQIAAEYKQKQVPASFFTCIYEAF